MTQKRLRCIHPYKIYNPNKVTQAVNLIKKNDFIGFKKKSFDENIHNTHC